MEKFTPISIVGMGSISALGADEKSVWRAYQKSCHFFSEECVDFLAVSGKISDENQKNIQQIRQENVKYSPLDKSVLYALYASRKALEQSGWGNSLDFGINLGSSRGATELFEKYHSEFLEKNQTSVLTSPTTTLGNIASWVAQDVGNEGVAISHSITCSTALHALLNGVAWLKSSMATKFLVGGSEAPLTNFTLAQMKALKIYANSNDVFPCRALQFPKQKNTLVLGEGACVLCLEAGISSRSRAVISGIGYAVEPLTHNISISADADCLQKTMQMALGDTPPHEVDVIIPHATGTIKGDEAEYRAIQKVFGEKIPCLTSNKWKIGHTFGASGAFSVEMAILMIENQQFVKIPYLENQPEPKQIRKVLINAIGFGGNAVSVLLSGV